MRPRGLKSEASQVTKMWIYKVRLKRFQCHCLLGLYHDVDNLQCSKSSKERNCKMTKTVGKMISLIVIPQIPETYPTLLRTRAPTCWAKHKCCAWLETLGLGRGKLSSLRKHPIGVPLLKLPARLTAAVLFAMGVWVAFCAIPGQELDLIG